jgi:hypothetical protein
MTYEQETANLFAKVGKLKPKDNIFTVENMLHADGLTASRALPNPIELA